jgi:hypothetical protein
MAAHSRKETQFWRCEMSPIEVPALGTEGAPSPKPQAPSPKPQAPSPKPQAPSPKPQAPSPKPL